MTLDVITIGRSSVDLYGAQIGGRLEDMASFNKYIGGSPTNMACGTARLGLKSGLITRVGDEHMGRFIREQLIAEGVDVQGVITDPERLTALVLLGIRDQEQFPLIFYRENCADMALCEDDIDPDYIASSRCVTVTGTHLSHPRTRAAVLKALTLARAPRQTGPRPLAGGRAHLVSGPQLGFRYYGPIEGRIITIDKSASEKMRLTLDHVRLSRVPPAFTPARVRVSLHGPELATDFAPGDVVMTTGHLGPPGGAVDPGGFDFRRHAWFLRLGAVGYSRVPLVVWEDVSGGQWVFRTRMAMSSRIQAQLPGANSRVVTAGAGADDDHVIAAHSFVLESGSFAGHRSRDGWAHAQEVEE